MRTWSPITHSLQRLFRLRICQPYSPREGETVRFYLARELPTQGPSVSKLKDVSEIVCVWVCVCVCDQGRDRGTEMDRNTERQEGKCGRLNWMEYI